MGMLYDLLKMIVCLMPDGGGGEAGGTGEGEGSNGTEGKGQAEGNGGGEGGGEEKEVKTMPKYFSQINPTKANSEDYKSLYDYQRLEDLADAALSLK